MNPLNSIVRSHIRLTRWISRGVSLLSIAFFLSLVLLNEDVRETVSLPFLVYGGIVAGLIVAWIRERTGGLIVMLATLVLGIIVVINGFTREDITLFTVIVGALILLLPNFLIGWLFFTVGQQEEAVAEVIDEESETFEA